MISLFLLFAILRSDFSICTAPSFQDYPVVKQVDDLYYVFWADQRLFSSTEKYAVYGARVTADGHVIDPDGKLIFCDSVADRFDVAFGVSNFLVVCRNGC